MAKMMTEHEAWTLIAEAFSAADSSGQTIIYGKPVGGLCRALSIIQDSAVVSSVVVLRMCSKVERYRKPDKIFWWPINKEGAAKRAAVCRELARETAPTRKAKVGK